MTQIFVSIGSNIDRQRHIVSAINCLAKKYSHMRQSPVYESAAVGFSGNPFYNLVVVFETQETPQQLLGYLRKLEDEHGRIRPTERFGARTLDLDMLTYGDQMIARHGLHLPREEILQYAFVLLPLVDLAPLAVHPQRNKTYQQLWLSFDKTAQVLRKVSVPGLSDSAGV